MRKKVKDSGEVGNKTICKFSFLQQTFRRCSRPKPWTNVKLRRRNNSCCSSGREERRQVSELLRPCLVSVCEPVNTKFVHLNVSALCVRTLLSVWGWDVIYWGCLKVLWLTFEGRKCEDTNTRVFFSALKSSVPAEFNECMTIRI